MSTIPGLDLTQLRALRSPHPATTALPTRIREHLDVHDGYVAFSGGKDSLVTLDLALRAEPNVPIVFFDSGLEFPETYQYLSAIQEHYGRPIDWIQARRTTLEVLVDSGYWDHDAPPARVAENLRTILVTEPAARAHEAHGPGEIWGVRAKESNARRISYAIALRNEIHHSCIDCCRDHRARRRHHGGIIRRVDGTVAFGPVWDWSTTQIWNYIAREGLPVNPVYAKLNTLGAPEPLTRVSHMLDGSCLEQGRVTWLRRGWPELFEELCVVLPRLREFV